MYLFYYVATAETSGDWLDIRLNICTLILLGYLVVCSESSSITNYPSRLRRQPFSFPLTTHDNHPYL